MLFLMLPNQGSNQMTDGEAGKAASLVATVCDGCERCEPQPLCPGQYDDETAKWSKVDKNTLPDIIPSMEDSHADSDRMANHGPNHQDLPD